MHVIEAALVTNLGSKARKAGDARRYGLTRRAAVGRALATVTVISVVVLVLQIASAGAAIHQGDQQIASLVGRG